MCIKKRFIKNTYTGKLVFVKCGKCPACLQERSNFQRMLINNTSPSGNCLFVTLTYDNQHVPFVSSADFFTDFLHIFRSNNLIESLFIKSSLDISYDSLHDSTFVNILYYHDIQNFFKSFRQTLSRLSCEIPEYSYCGEYGTRTFRPHFHVLFFFQNFSDKEIIISTIVKTWQFCDWSKLPFDECFKFVPSKDVSGYVSSYITGNSFLPVYAQIKEIAPKIRHSKFFGSNVSFFSLQNFWNSAYMGCISYFRNESSSTSLPKNFLYPKYIVSRYFPKFKGYSRLNLDAFIYIVSTVIISKSVPRYFVEFLEYDSDDCHRCILVCRKYLDYSKLLGVPLHVYLSTFFNFYNKLNSFLIKSVHVDSNGDSLPSSHLRYCYDNLYHYVKKSYLCSNPNFYPDNLLKHYDLCQQFSRKKHEHLVKQIINPY